MKNHPLKEAADAGLTNLNQARAILIIGSLGPHPVGALADKLGVEHGTLTGLADKLVDLGLAVRQRTKTDRRIHALAITPKGQRLANSLAYAPAKCF